MSTHSKTINVIVVDADGQALDLDADGSIPTTTSFNNPVVTWTPFQLDSTTAWTTVVSATGSETIELRIFGISNSSASVSNVAFRFGTNSAFFDQPIPAGGGGYNQNCIGGYIVGGAAENLQVMSGSSVDSIWGHVVTRTIS